MGRGVSSGGGQSSLGYLFGSGEAPKPTTNGNVTGPSTISEVPKTQNEVAEETPQKSTTASPPADVARQVPAGIPGNNANNYFRADGQNSGNFLTVATANPLTNFSKQDRRTTKVHAAPGGGSSLDYLFGGNGK
ncbi:protein SPIRAL1-like 1 isoform X1 [Herrania umbratica]|uniref:Protein SPIRAL1-like 1 isoform X1 n=1 Tax=Herrania umbratica TaxID=108875 RepID=A0A6J1AG76_9ROSI|nr:protein SPIRAL1-like 1 isoform X1 [Herrania umbratica]XP_021286217.1 protein SPIRAL1-like 1 isoform X1 [Herrania umbratica]